MGFSKKTPDARVSMDRLAAVAGGASAAAATAAANGETAAPLRRVSVEPDVSRIRKSSIDETPAERKKRLAAKTINFGATFLARIVIMAALSLYAWAEHQSTGQIHRGIAAGLLAMLADFGRVMMKAMEPGSK